MIVAFFALVAVTIAAGLLDWRRGALLCVPVGFLQDPARKLIAERPVAMVVVVAICFVACLLGAMLRDGGLGVRPFYALYPRLRVPVILFVAWVVLQSAMTLLRTGRPVLAGLGLLSYLSPPLALLLGFRFASRSTALERWTWVYLAGGGLVAATVGLEFAGVEHVLFDSIGVDIVYGTSGLVEMMSGLMRSSEIAAWHLAAALCLAVGGVVTAARLRTRLVLAALAGGLFIALLLTGRRKMLAEVALFALFFVLLLAARRGRAPVGLRWSFAALLAAALAFQLVSRGRGLVLVPYVQRGVTVVAESTQRLEGMTVGQLGSIVSRTGFLGLGAGTGAQGAQYFGGGVELVGGAAEGGLGKILAELGVPGVAILAWLSIAFGRALRRIARGAGRLPQPLAVPAYALIAFLPANLAVFLTAHQVYGDPFVLIVLGWLAGAVLALPHRARAEGAIA